jgi:hypothetical protein
MTKVSLSTTLPVSADKGVTGMGSYGKRSAEEVSCPAQIETPLAARRPFERPDRATHTLQS